MPAVPESPPTPACPCVLCAAKDLVKKFGAFLNGNNPNEFDKVKQDVNALKAGSVGDILDLMQKFPVLQTRFIKFCDVTQRPPRRMALAGNRTRHVVRHCFDPP